MKLFITALFALFVSPVSIYTISLDSAAGGSIPLDQYQGKRILIANVGTNSVYAPQLTQLQQLYQQHSSNLVVIAFPSNSFGNEPRSNAEIMSFMESTYGITFPIAAKGNVTDSTGPIHPLYYWLTKKIHNGVMNTKVRGDFQKYLVNKQGNLVAVFDSATSPIGSAVQQALNIHQ